MIPTEEKRLTIVYAEDDQETSSNYTIILKEYFKHVYTASNGKQALDLYKSKKPDVVLLDVSMPVMDGLEVAEHIRKDDKSTKIVIFTAHSEKERLLKAVNLHLDEYLLKPVDFIKFQNLLERLVYDINSKDHLDLFADFSWNNTTKELIYDEDSVRITKKESLLLQLLCSDPSRHFSMEEISKKLWKEPLKIEHQNRIKQLISRFKNKIYELSSVKDGIIENSYALGYKIKLKNDLNTLTDKEIMDSISKQTLLDISNHITLLINKKEIIGANEEFYKFIDESLHKHFQTKYYNFCDFVSMINCEVCDSNGKNTDMTLAVWCKDLLNSKNAVYLIRAQYLNKKYLFKVNVKSIEEIDHHEIKSVTFEDISQ